MYKYNNPSEVFYKKQLNAIWQLNANKEEVINCNKSIGKGGYNEIFTNGKYVVFNPREKQDEKLQTRKNFNKALANALLSAGGRNTLKYGLTNEGQVYTKSKLGLVNMVNNMGDDDTLWNIVTSIEYGRSDGFGGITNDNDNLPTYELLYPLPQLLLLGMIDRNPDNTVMKYTKAGSVKCYEIDHDDMNNASKHEIEPSHLFNCNDFWRKYNIRKYLNKLDDQSKKDKDFKNKIATLIENFTLTKKKMEYVIKYTTMQAYYLGLDKEEIKSFLKKDMERYLKYLEKLKKYNDDDHFLFMKEEIGKFCETSQNCLFNIKKEDVDKIVDDTFEYEEKNRNIGIRAQISQAINQHLGKPKDKRKKLYWDREGKDGKFLNTRFFLKENAGYIRKINNYYDKMCKEGKQNDVGELNNLLDLAKNAYYRPICACY